MTQHGAFWLVLALFAAALVLASCAPSGVSRECSFARPLVLSHKSIAGLDEDDARAILTFNRTVQQVCG